MVYGAIKKLYWLARLMPVPTLALAIYLPVALLHTVATSQVQRIDAPYVEARQLGDPERALEQITHTISTVEHLDSLAQAPSRTPQEQMVFANSPLLLERPGMFSGHAGTPLGLYYTVQVSAVGETQVTTIEYYIYFSGESGGMPLAERLARFGRALDTELVYRVTFLDDRIMSAYYQAPSHRMQRFAYDGTQRPVFAIASTNHNFRRASAAEGPTVAFIPQNEFAANPLHDTDFLALAARQALLQDGIDLSRYVYISFNRAYQGPMNVSVRVNGEWYYLHDVVGDGRLGESVTVRGYYLAAIELPFAPQSNEIEEVRIVAWDKSQVDATILAIYVYPKLRIAA